LDANAADVRFLQATRHGETITPVELIEGHADALADRAGPVMERIRRGESVGLALVREDVPVETRRMLLAHFVAEELADGLDRHYLYRGGGRDQAAFYAELAVEEVRASMARVKRRAQWIGALALAPFTAVIVVHALDDRVPLFLASFAGFLTALPAIAR